MLGCTLCSTSCGRHIETTGYSTDIGLLLAIIWHLVTQEGLHAEGVEWVVLLLALAADSNVRVPEVGAAS